MNIKLLFNYFEKWAPREIAWENDNIGLQIGNPDEELKNVLIALEVDEKVVEQAIKKKCNVIFTHHPFLFTPLKKLDFSDKKAQIIQKLIENGITLYSAHTNLDYTKNGVSFQLAEKLGLNDIDFLENQSATQVKLVLFAPSENIDEIANAIFAAGGGIIGEYSSCSAQHEVVGTFKGSEKSDPFIGEKNRFEKVKETRLEVVIDSWKINSIIDVMKSIHPYEEPVFDIYPLKNKNSNYGAGAIGNLPKSLSKLEFLSHVAKLLGANNLSYTNGRGKKIKRVAVCGGTCSHMFPIAISKGADAFITSDVKYHTFQDAEKKILLIDAGHYETEIHVLNEVKSYIEKFIKKNRLKIKVYKYTGSTNPVKFFNNNGVIHD